MSANPQTQEDRQQHIALDHLLALLARLGLMNVWLTSTGARTQAMEALQLDFQRAARELAAKVTQDGDIRAWQQGMARIIAQDMLEARILGAGRLLTAAELAEMDTQMMSQITYLNRFADQVRAGIIGDNPMSEAMIGARSELYDRARGQFYRGLESDQIGTGFVEDYIARDDNSTCGPCEA